jgi:hypothetical protein
MLSSYKDTKISLIKTGVLVRGLTSLLLATGQTLCRAGFLKSVYKDNILPFLLRHCNILCLEGKAN